MRGVHWVHPSQKCKTINFLLVPGRSPQSILQGQSKVRQLSEGAIDSSTESAARGQGRALGNRLGSSLLDPLPAWGLMGVAGVPWGDVSDP